MAKNGQKKRDRVSSVSFYKALVQELILQQVQQVQQVQEQPDQQQVQQVQQERQVQQVQQELAQRQE